MREGGNCVYIKILKFTQCNGGELGLERTEGAFELTKCSEASSIAPKVGSTEFIDIALGNNFITVDFWLIWHTCQ